MTIELRNTKLLLASSSASRKLLLERFGIPFDVLPPHIDESPTDNESPTSLVQRLSLEKAAVVAQQCPGALVLGSDQVAVHDGVVTGKPGTAERARELLARFSGQRLMFITGVVLLCPQQSFSDYIVDHTEVVFRTLSDTEIARYVELDKPLDCSGSFRLESMGPALFESVHSRDPTALLGLPLIGLADMLRKAGYRLP